MVDSSLSKLLNSKKSKKKQGKKSLNSKKYKEFLDKKRKYSKKKNPINSILLNNKTKNKTNIKKKIGWSINKPVLKENKNSKPNISLKINEDKPVDEKVDESKKEKSVEGKPVDEKVDESKKEKPEEEKPVDEKVDESNKEKPVEEKSVEKPVEEKPVEEKPVEETLKKVNIEANVKDPVFKFDRSESKPIRKKTKKKSKKKKPKKNRKVSFFVKKSKKKDKDTLKKLADNVNNKNSEDMIKELKEKGITISGKSNNLLKDIYFCVMNDNININKE